MCTSACAYKKICGDYSLNESNSMHFLHKIKIQNIQQLTSRLIIRWHSSTKRFVPNILIFTDSSNFSSNFTVAAEWNTMDTLRNSVCWSVSEMPSWSCVISPHIGITLLKSLGLSFRIVSNSWKLHRLYRADESFNNLDTNKMNDTVEYDLPANWGDH